MQGELVNRGGLVTGAGGGIGRAAALVMAREGGRVMVADVDVEGGEETVALIRAQGGEAAFQRTDVSDAAAVDALVAATVERFGRLDWAVNNAGIEGERGNTVDCSDANWSRTLAVNLTGAWYCLRAELRQMRQQGGGAIVNMASIAGLVGFEGLPAYVASKHALVGLTKTAALEFAPHAIRVNAVCPGVIQTAMIDRLIGGDPAMAAGFAAGEPIGRLGRAEEIGEAVAWL
ncbi:MAG TPA: SDR family oxidoreductase, partial [Candidatus Macondimonas sp.]|nr:SDR family oxidoreductase [Candidatus Macondimonas sp.]